MIYYLSFGSNIGERSAILDAATKEIAEKAGQILAQSNKIETVSWGFQADNFLNMAIKLESDLKPEQMLELLLKIEQNNGRVRDVNKKSYCSRKIDIDIIFADNLVLETQNLVIPHPLMHKRFFVLSPLCQIAPDFIHPILKKSNMELLKEIEIYE